MLGAGAFGEVRVCVHRESGAQRAVKVLRKSHMDEDEKKMFFNEINILKDLDHPNILKMYEFFEDEKRYYIVTDICNGGEQFDEIVNRGKFSESDASLLMKLVLGSINYFHQNHIVHRDLKLENILVDMDGYLKIIDFGLAKMLDSGSMTRTYCGTPEYLAPEMILQSGHNFSIDWWALGILIYEMRIGVTPFFNKNKNLLLTKIQRAKVIFPDQEKYGLDYSQEFVDIVEKLLDKNQKTRLGSEGGVKEVLQHPWFADIDIKKVEA